jgi:uncharacterized protein
MREELLKLCELQEIDVDIDTCQKALAALDNGNSTKALLAEQTATADAAVHQRQHLDGEYRDRDLELKAIEARKKKAEELMSSGRVSNLRQLEDLQKEVAMFDKEIDRISTRTLEIMDELESARKIEQESKAAVETTKTRLAQILEKYQKTGVRLKQELIDLKEKRIAFLPTIADSVRKRYEQTQNRLGVLAVGEVIEDLCEGCHVALPSSLLNQVKSAKTIQTCDSCGRILVWTADE